MLDTVRSAITFFLHSDFISFLLVIPAHLSFRYHFRYQEILSRRYDQNHLAGRSHLWGSGKAPMPLRSMQALLWLLLVRLSYKLKIHKDS